MSYCSKCGCRHHCRRLAQGRFAPALACRRTSRETFESVGSTGRVLYPRLAPTYEHQHLPPLPSPGFTSKLLSPRESDPITVQGELPLMFEIPQADAAPGGASRQRSLPRTTTPSHRRVERAPDYRPASSQRGTSSRTGVGRGDPGPAPDGPGEAHRAHQARHGAARHAMPSRRNCFQTFRGPQICWCSL